jgi:hypothetical protein
MIPSEASKVVKVSSAVSLSSNVVAENSAAGTTVGALSVFGGTPTFTLVSGTGDTDNASFTIDGSTLKTTASFDYEAKSSYSIRVRAVISGGSTYEQVFTINVTDVSEIGGVSTVPPTDISLSAETVKERSAIGTTVGTLSATDADAGDTFTYSLLSAEEAPKANNDSFTIDGDELLTAEVFDFDEQSEYDVAVRVTDSGGLIYEETLAITVTEANVKLSRNNKVITFTYKENIINAATTNAATALKAAVSISTNANAGSPSYNMTLGANDKIAISKNKLVITLATALDSQFIKVKLAANALRDTFGNKTPEITSDMIAADKSNPTIDSVTVSGKNKIITVKFNEPVLNGSSASKAPEQLAALKGSITIAKNADAGSPTYASLVSADKIGIVKGRLVITLATALTGANNAIKITADALKDAAGNKNAALTSSTFSADLTGPALAGLSISANKVITLKFNESVTISSTPAALKTAVKLATDGETFNGLVLADKVAASKNTLTITLATPISGEDNKIEVAADALKDGVGNKNLLITTSAMIADATGPAIASAKKTSEKVIAITFNETATIVSTSTKAPEQLAALKTKISLATNGNAGTPTYTPLGSGDSISYAKGVLTVTLGTALSGANNKLKIAAGALKDAAGVENADTTTSLIAADSSGPTLSSATIDATNKIVTLTFNEAIVNAAAGANATAQLTALKAAISITKTGSNSAALAATDKIVLKANTLTITFTSALSGNANIVNITTENLKDALGNKSDAITTSAIVADATAPELK